MPSRRGSNTYPEILVTTVASLRATASSTYARRFPTQSEACTPAGTPVRAFTVATSSTLSLPGPLTPLGLKSARRQSRKSPEPRGYSMSLTSRAPEAAISRFGNFQKPKNRSSLKPLFFNSLMLELRLPPEHAIDSSIFWGGQHARNSSRYGSREFAGPAGHSAELGGR